MQNLNRAEIIGHLAADPDVRHTSTTTIVRLRVGTTRKWKSEKTGNAEQETDWHNVTCFGQIGTNASKYLRKGRFVRVIGRMKSSEYEKEGIKFRAFEIVATEPIGFMDKNPDQRRDTQQQQQQPDNHTEGW